MTLDGLLTFLAIVVAGYAAAPIQTKLSIRINSPFWVVITILCSIAVVYLEFFNALSLQCPSYFSVSACDFLQVPVSGKNKDQLSAEQIAFLVVLLWLIFACILLINKSVFAFQLKSLEKQISLLLSTRDFLTCVEYLEANTHHLNGYDFTQQLQTSNDEDIENILRSISRNKEFVEYIVLYHYKLASQLFYIERPIEDGYLEKALPVFISAKNSHLYSEIVDYNNAYRSYRHGNLEEENTITFSLFRSADLANRFATYRVLGEYFIERLKHSEENERYISWLNKCSEGQDIEDFKTDELCVVLLLFDIMITKAAFEEVDWHMWLYYLPHFTTAILKVFDNKNSSQHQDQEYPLRFSYLINEIIDMLFNWTELYIDLPEDNHHTVSFNVDNQHQNECIPKSACIALGQNLFLLLNSNVLSSAEKKQFHDHVLSKLRRVPSKGRDGCVRRTLILTIVQGGGSNHNSSLAYKKLLRDFWKSYDAAKKDELLDYKKAIMH